MVFHSKPQGPGSQSIIVNANNPPQGQPGSGITPPPPGTAFWVDDNSNQFIDDTGESFVFTET